METVVSELLTAALQSGCPVACFALLPESAPLPTALRELEQQGVRLVRVPARHRAYREQYRDLRKALAQHDVGLVHSHGYHADVLAGFAARSLRIPHVSTLHGFIGSTMRGRMYEWLQLRTLRRASAVIAVAEPIRERTRLSGVRADCIHVIPNAAPGAVLLSRDAARRALHLPLDARALGWVGRMSAEKNPEEFVRLIRTFPADSNTVGAMLGDGPAMARVVEAAGSLVSERRLVLPGVVPGAGSLISAFDALLVTSHTEGTPMVVLEAMRAGVPVVSTAVGGVPAMLEGGAGELVAPGDESALYEATARVLDDAALSARLAAAAQQRVDKRYGRDAWWQRHERLYAQLLRSASR